VNERSVAAREFVYLMLNKPRGCDYYGRDEKGRATVLNFLDKEVPWVAPVGRLDKASEGLLLLTNDSEWSARILAPESHVEKDLPCADSFCGSGCGCGPAGTWNGVAGRIAPSPPSVGAEARRSNAWLEMVLNEGKKTDTFAE